MKQLALFVISLSLISCSGSGVSRELAGADSLVITFNQPGSDAVLKTVSTTEPGAIKKLAGFLKGKKAELYKCGYDGNLVFYKRGEQLLPVLFKFSEADCRHFLLDQNNKLSSVAMNGEAERFFRSLLEGKAGF